MGKATSPYPNVAYGWVVELHGQFGISPALLLHTVLFSVGILPAYRALMVWVYDRTGSLLVAMLMHASLTTSNVIFIPLAPGAVLAIWSLVLAVALWIVVLAASVRDVIV